MDVQLLCRACGKELPCRCAARTVHQTRFAVHREKTLRLIRENAVLREYFSGMSDDDVIKELETHLTYKDEIWLPWSKRTDGTHVMNFPRPTREACEAEIVRLGVHQQGFQPIELGDLPPEYSAGKAALLENERLKELVHYLAVLSEKLKKDLK